MAVEPHALATVDHRTLVQRLTEQPELFALDPETISLVRAVRTYQPTGERITHDEEKVAGIVLGKLLGWSDRRIAREVAVGRNSIGPAVIALEARGVLEPLKDRCRRWLGELTEQTILRAREELGAEKTDAALLRSLWVGAGIGTDKMGDQAPAQSHQHLHIHSEAAAESVRDLVRRLRGDHLVPSDSESDHASSESTPCVCDRDLCASSDTDSGPGSGHGTTLEAEVLCQVEAGQDPGRGRDDRGGGCEPRGPAETPDGAG